MRRVVVTGMGMVSCLGHTKESVLESLREGISGIRFNEKFEEMGLRSQVSGSVDIDLSEHIDRKHLRFMGDAASYAYISMQKAIDDAGLDDTKTGMEELHRLFVLRLLQLDLFPQSRGLFDGKIRKRQRSDIGRERFIE